MPPKQLLSIISCLMIAACVSSPATSDKSVHPGQYDHQNAFQFALIGDTPYDVLPQEKSESFDKLVASINGDHNIQWVLHAGDIKSGSTPCSNMMFKDRKLRFDQFQKPFILTPGDNEWTDCHRVSAGEYQPRERLAKLRSVFYPKPGESLGKTTMPVQSQAFVEGYETFPENVMWEKQNVVFATMHLVGSQNGLDHFDHDSRVNRTSADDQEVLQRSGAALYWLNHVFKRAKQIQAGGVFIMIHANPGMDWLFDDRKGFERFHSALESKVKHFAKPVVLAHGDTHKFRVDSPELGQSDSLPNFTRVETFGTTNSKWVRVTVNPASKTLFSFEAIKI